MRRRTVLAGLTSSLAAGFAGCVTGGTTDTKSTPSQSTVQSTDTVTGPDTGPIYNPGDSLVLRDGRLSVSQAHYTYRSSVPYYDPDTESTETLYAPDDLFLSYRLEFYNRGGDSVTPPSRDLFSSWVTGDVSSQLRTLPENVSWDQLRQGDTNPRLYRPWWVLDLDWSSLNSDESHIVTFLFSIPDVPISEVYVRFSPDSRDDPVFFAVKPPGGR